MQAFLWICLYNRSLEESILSCFFLRCSEESFWKYLKKKRRRKRYLRCNQLTLVALVRYKTELERLTQTPFGRPEFFGLNLILVVKFCIIISCEKPFWEFWTDFGLRWRTKQYEWKCFLHRNPQKNWTA